MMMSCEKKAPEAGSRGPFRALLVGTGNPLLLKLSFARHFAGCALPEKIEGGRESIDMPRQYDIF